MSWFRPNPREVPADREIPALDLWVVRMSDGSDINVLAHEVTRDRSDVLKFQRYTSGRWLLDYDFGHHWSWNRSMVIEIREWIYVAPFEQPQEQMWWHD